MIDLIREMLATPEAQADAYVWAAVFMAHAMIGAALTILVMAIWMRGPWQSAAMVSAAYAAGWEGGQLGHVDKWRSQRRIDVMSMKPRKLSAVLS